MKGPGGKQSVLALDGLRSAQHWWTSRIGGDTHLLDPRPLSGVSDLCPEVRNGIRSNSSTKTQVGTQRPSIVKSLLTRRTTAHSKHGLLQSLAYHRALFRSCCIGSQHPYCHRGRHSSTRGCKASKKPLALRQAFAPMINRSWTSTSGLRCVKTQKALAELLYAPVRKTRFRRMEQLVLCKSQVCTDAYAKGRCRCAVTDP